MGAGDNATNAYNSNFLGSVAGINAASASNSNFLGSQAGQNATNAYNSNFIGQDAGYFATSASYSNLIGYGAGQNNNFPSNGIGSNNIIIGTSITLPDNYANGLNIGGLIFGSGSYNSINTPSSGSANGKIGINQPNPTYNLDVVGSGNYSNGLNVTGSHNISGSISATNTIVLPKVSSSYNFINDAAAAAGGIPLGGLYRSGSLILIRLA